MTATLPQDVQRVFERFIAAEFTTIDRHAQPITWPVTPFYSAGMQCIDVTTGVGYPKKADDAARNAKVAMLFSDPTGAGLERVPMVLVQGSAEVDDEDLHANRERYVRETAEKLPATQKSVPPERAQRAFNWYFTRIYVHVRPERVYVWPGGDCEREPELLDSHMEEVRSGHDEEPEAPPPAPEGGTGHWHGRIEELGRRYGTAVVSFVAPDGFPFSVRVPVSADRRARLIRIEADPVGAPLQPGLACVTAHEHAGDMTWQRNFQVRGDLVEADGGWAIVPHRLVDGFELPPSGAVTRVVTNFRKVMRFRRTAKREMARRGA